ncbi:MAG: sigma-54-dependent Fis family transcriptional regulator [Planctomycetota bacterium]|nr:MAG: sigma-54-dependent Fis family transcriptional regulator [Planctomycetota bacterium]
MHAEPGSEIVVLCQKQSLLAQLAAQFGDDFTLRVVDRPETIAEAVRPEATRAVVAHLGSPTWGDTSPLAFLARLTEFAGSQPVYVVADDDLPEAIRRAADEKLEACLTLPPAAARLEKLVRRPVDPVARMAGPFSNLAHRALHGRTGSLITFTPAMFGILDELKVAAAHNVTILLIGETGSGKSYLARLIHEISPAADERFYTVACGALPPDLIESEMFGYVRGAFTGADRDKAGKFHAAGRGTLLLDEIDVLPAEHQAKLLRVIESGEYEPVGSNETALSEARLVVASNYDLESLVEQGSFRRDLYYRLNVLSFRLPPLRERPRDIDFLARQFAFAHARKHAVEIRDIDETFVEALRHYAWPGNVRELENVIRRAVLYCQRGTLTVADLPSPLRPSENPRPAPPGDDRKGTLEWRVGSAERQIIEDTLRRNANRRQATAAELGISRVTLYNKMKKFGLLSSAQSS